MKLNYKPIGKYIREVKVRNENNETKNLLGININKYYMPSVANIVGTDLSVYKIVKRGQFACNRMHVGRDMRLPVALSSADDDFIVSPAYDVFEITDTSILSPEYLMMWFTRSEFDRNAWFYTDADVRGGLSWMAFCEMQLPVPHPDKQKEIVAEYNTIQNRIDLNKQLIQKLEETAQAIYKNWFVDFEFPDENGNPYKSNGGEMVESELGDVPKGWRGGTLSDVTKIIMGQSPDGESYNTDKTGTVLINGPVEFGEYFTNQTKWTTIVTKLSEVGDLIICVRGSTTGRYVKSDGRYCLGRGVCSFRAKKSQAFVDYLYKINLNKLLSYTTGSTFPNWDGQTLSKYPVTIPESNLINMFDSKIKPFTKHIELLSIEIIKLNELQHLLLSKLATIEN